VLVFPIDTPAVRDLWTKWKKYRWEQYDTRYGMMGEQADLRRLQGMTFQQIEKTILSAIANNWKNLYPEKEQKRHDTGITNKKQQQSEQTGQYLTDYYKTKLGNTP
jgi:Zn/Cd-binding protein ZinT